MYFSVDEDNRRGHAKKTAGWETERDVKDVLLSCIEQLSHECALRYELAIIISYTTMAKPIRALELRSQ